MMAWHQAGTWISLACREMCTQLVGKKKIRAGYCELAHHPTDELKANALTQD